VGTVHQRRIRASRSLNFDPDTIRYPPRTPGPGAGTSRPLATGIARTSSGRSTSKTPELLGGGPASRAAISSQRDPYLSAYASCYLNCDLVETSGMILRGSSRSSASRTCMWGWAGAAIAAMAITRFGRGARAGQTVECHYV
jgi:hypothetical protein